MGASHSNPNIPTNQESNSRSNTFDESKLSIDADSKSEDVINDEIINEIIADSDNLQLAELGASNNGNSNNNDIEMVEHMETSNPSNPAIHELVGSAYRKLLVHESKRLKAENGRLLRKVEKMRCIRSSMQNIFDQLQDNDQQLQTISHSQNIEESKEHKIEQEEEEDLEIEHLNDLHHLERIRMNSH